MKRPITVVSTVHPPDDPRIRHKTIGTLVDAGWDVTYICRDPGPTDDSEISVVPLPGPRLGRLLRAAIAMAGSASDVIILEDPDLLVPGIPIAAVRRSTRFVFDLHEYLPEQLATRDRTPWWLRRITAGMASLVLRVVERVMDVTLAEPGYGVLFRRSHPVFANYPMTETLPLRADDATGVVYVGDITEARGARVLVDAVARLDDVPLIMIGRCQDDLALELHARADEAGFALELTGFLPYAEAWSMASRALVGVSPLKNLPNYRDSLPTKLLEYRAVGLAVVASDLPGTRSVLSQDGAVILVPPDDAVALSDAIATVLTDPETQEAALEGAEVVRASWRWDATGFAAFYQGLVPSCPAGEKA